MKKIVISAVFVAFINLGLISYSNNLTAKGSYQKDVAKSCCSKNKETASNSSCAVKKSCSSQSERKSCCSSKKEKVDKLCCSGKESRINIDKVEDTETTSGKKSCCSTKKATKA